MTIHLLSNRKKGKNIAVKEPRRIPGISGLSWVEDRSSNVNQQTVSLLTSCKRETTFLQNTLRLKKRERELSLHSISK